MIWLFSKVGTLFTARVSTNALFLAFLCIAALASAVSNLRRRRWLNVVLAFAFIPLAVVAWSKAGLSLQQSFWIAPYFILMAIPRSRDLRLSQRISGVLLISVGFLSSIGLLGHMGWAQRAEGLLNVAMTAWFYYFFYLRSQLKPQIKAAAAV